jgi:hypothetical protein
MVGEARAKSSLLLLLTQSLLHAHRTASNVDRAPLQSALADLISNLQDISTTISQPEDNHLADLDKDVQQRALEDEGVLRVAAAACLLRVAARLSDMLPTDAYVSLALTLQDPSEMVWPTACVRA